MMVQKGFEVPYRGPPFLANLESTEVAFAQPLHNTVLVDLKGLGDLEWH